MGIGEPKRTPVLAIAVAGAAISIVLPGLAAVPDAPTSPQQQARWDSLCAQGVEASLTVFPVVLGGQGMKEAAEVVAVLLEQAGMESLELADAVFVLPEDAAFSEAAKHFGEFVREHPIITDFALYAEIIGTRETGPQEIRGVIVDKDGATAWVDRQTPDDALFKRLKPDCPMTCCILLSERLSGELRLPASARKNEGEGKLAKRLFAKSGLPDENERADMEDRLAIMKKVGRSAKVAVFPVLVAPDEVSLDSASHLAQLLVEQELFDAGTVATELRIEVEPARDEMKMLWDLARKFREHVRRHPIDADYALYAQYLLGRRDGRVRAVHFVIVDKAGEWVIVDFQNDHWEDFQSVDPKTREDCGLLAAKRIAGYLR